MRFIAAKLYSFMPKVSAWSMGLLLDKKRSTAFSPYTVGITDVLMFTSFESMRVRKWPSCGRRRAAMLRLASTLTREMIGCARRLGGGVIS